MEITDTTTASVNAYFDVRGGETTTDPGHARVDIVVPTPADAEALAARFPKSTRVRATTLSSLDGPTRGVVCVWVVLAANGNNGGVNETGIKRLRSVVRAARRQGLTVRVASEGAVNVMSPAQFFAMIGEPETV